MAQDFQRFGHPRLNGFDADRKFVGYFLVLKFIETAQQKSFPEFIGK
jgi:hypothetical protein